MDMEQKLESIQKKNIYRIPKTISKNNKAKNDMKYL